MCETMARPRPVFLAGRAGAGATYELVEDTGLLIRGDARTFVPDTDGDPFP